MVKTLNLKDLEFSRYRVQIWLTAQQFDKVGQIESHMNVAKTVRVSAEFKITVAERACFALKVLYFIENFMFYRTSNK